MTETEEAFRQVVRVALNHHHIPTPTQLNVAMGWRGGPNHNNLNGKYSRIRREEFLAAGLVKVPPKTRTAHVDYDIPGYDRDKFSGKWRWPDDPAAQHEGT